MEEKYLNKAMKKSEKIQPTHDAIRARDTIGMDEFDVKHYDKIVFIYKLLNEIDATFILAFNSPHKYVPNLFFRICNPEEKERFDQAYRMLYRTFLFLYDCGYIDALEQHGILKVSDGFRKEHKTQKQRWDEGSEN